MNKTKKILTIKLSSGRILYVDNDTIFDWTSNASRAVDFSSYTDEQLKEYIDKIDNFSFVRDNESFDFVIQNIKIDIDEEIYTPSETLIKTALNRLSTREIEALGLEDISLYHTMKESHKQFQNNEDCSPAFAYSSNLKAKSSIHTRSIPSKSNGIEQNDSDDKELVNLIDSEISNMNGDQSDEDSYGVIEDDCWEGDSEDEEIVDTFIKNEVQSFNKGNE